MNKQLIELNQIEIANDKPFVLWHVAWESKGNHAKQLV